MTTLAEAEEMLRSWGLACCGRSAKSASTYWGVDPVCGPKVLRLSDHDVAYESSDCFACVGVDGCQDCDLILTGDWHERLRDLARRAIEHGETEGDAREQIESDAESEGVPVESIVADKLDWCRRHFPRLY